MKTNSIKLYNLIFPIWLLWIFPLTWIIILPGNLIIDWLVVTLSMKYLKITDIKEKVNKVILRVYLIGFLSDFIGTLGMFLSLILDFDSNTAFGKWWQEYMVSAVSYNAFENIYSFLWVTICLLLAALSIYLLNYHISFKKLDITLIQRKKLSLSLAIFTAPYLFYLPTKYFY
ncbi:MAG: hypothetical protein E7231_07125 [Cellulosilyticum sp.]|nr:hypothetical protein [Cellulosilyticum sp.]